MVCVKDEWSSRTTLCDTGLFASKYLGRTALVVPLNRIRTKDAAMLGTHRGG